MVLFFMYVRLATLALRIALQFLMKHTSNACDSCQHCHVHIFASAHSAHRTILDTAGALSMDQSELYVDGDTYFANNYAAYGGKDGMYAFNGRSDECKVPTRFPAEAQMENQTIGTHTLSQPKIAMCCARSPLDPYTESFQTETTLHSPHFRGNLVVVEGLLV